VVYYACILILVLLFLSNVVSAKCESIYFKAGAGYKFHEMDSIVFYDTEGKPLQTVKFDSEPISARFELAADCDRVVFGVSHHSQYASGWPANEKGEYFKTEIFIDIKFDVWEF
jgi:hypothetical protein